jgi:hypothetical protein
MARKKPLIKRAADMMQYIDDKLELAVNDPPLHKEILALLDEISELDEERNDLDDDWYYDNGY